MIYVTSKNVIMSMIINNKNVWWGRMLNTLLAHMVPSLHGVITPPLFLVSGEHTGQIISVSESRSTVSSARRDRTRNVFHVLFSHRIWTDNNNKTLCGFENICDY